MTEKEYIKKVPIIDARSSPEARANRLRRLRNIANLKREELSKGADITLSSLKRWELGYYGGLPLDGAKNIIEYINKIGVVCSLEWLLHDSGASPIIDPNYQILNNEGKSSPYSNKKNQLPAQKDEQFIIGEILLFRKNYVNTVDLKIKDDGLSPKYKIGDFVAGIKVNDIDSLLNQDCIIQTVTGLVLLRNLRKGQAKDCYNLICTNEQTTVTTPILYNVKIEIAAPVLRHYKKI